MNWPCFSFDNEKDPDDYEQFELVKNGAIWTEWMDAGVSFWSEKKKNGNGLFQPSGTDTVVLWPLWEKKTIMSQTWTDALQTIRWLWGSRTEFNWCFIPYIWTGWEMLMSNMDWVILVLLFVKMIWVNVLSMEE